MITNIANLENRNIDNMIDMLVAAQKTHGVEPTMKRALFDPNTKERVNCHKRKKLEDRGVDLTDYQPDDCKSHDQNGSIVSNIERGIFVYNEDDLYDEEDGDYICEYCTKISYNNKYKPDACDVCKDCDECTEFQSGECDGCKYSLMYNDGKSYGETNKDEYEMDQSDVSIYEELDNEIDDTINKPKNFTIMNY